jgi:hypothetical protein
MFLSPCGDAFAHLPAVKLACDGYLLQEVHFACQQKETAI